MQTDFQAEWQVAKINVYIIVVYGIYYVLTELLGNKRP